MTKRILKAHEKKRITYKGVPIHQKRDFSAKILKIISE
jgi:hypothetical protein